ncbi:MAG: ABC transporter substrate-binding protein [Acidobacteria bacterium]|nr:ABC transporter substrate-binding protein [Acidobacteriota bacterium]
MKFARFVIAVKNLASLAEYWSRNLKVRPPRLVGVLVTAGLLAALLLVLRPGSRPSPDAGGTRGGQIVASIRAEPRTFNPFVAGDQTSEALTFLMQGRLVRINRATFELEPWLAETWESSAEGRTHTLHLRPGVTWSDGTPFTSADVLFSLRAVHDPKVKSVLAGSLRVGGQPIRAAAPDPRTVVVTFAGPSGPGLRLLDGLPILPKHKLEAALAAGTFASAWNTGTPPADVVGTGPFVLREYQPGQRVVLDRNPRYWRKAQDGTALPYLDRIVLQVVPEQNAELLRIQSGEIDLTSGELGPEDYVPIRRAEEEGRLQLIELGVGPDADAFWFCLKPDAKRTDPRFAFVQRPEFRQAISYAVDREAFAETVFLGAAVPVWGPVTPGNTRWFWPDVPRYLHDDARARALLQGIGLEDRNGNGVVEDAGGAEARFTVITQRGIEWYVRGTSVLREELARVGIALDIAPLEFGAMIERMLACDYDAMYYRPVTTDLDPAGNMDFWLSAGSAHFWNLAQRIPTNEWERRIDTLMLEQAAALDLDRRRQQFNLVQRIFAENLPVLYFAAPRMYYAYSLRLRGVIPSVLRPPVLWNADSLSVTP